MDKIFNKTVGILFAVGLAYCIFLTFTLFNPFGGKNSVKDIVDNWNKTSEELKKDLDSIKLEIEEENNKIQDLQDEISKNNEVLDGIYIRINDNNAKLDELRNGLDSKVDEVEGMSVDSLIEYLDNRYNK